MQSAMKPADEILLSLKDADFSTAHRLADVISGELGDSAAKAIDPATVSVRVPAVYQDSLPDLLARIEPLRFEMDAPARVVINERTGTVVIGSDVRIGRAAVAHGNLSVRISTHYDVSQPNPLRAGPDRRGTAGESGRLRGRSATRRTRRRRHARRRCPGAQRARRDAEGHHRDHAGTEDGRSASCRAGDHVSVEFANVVSGQSATAQGATDTGARPDADRARIAEAAKQFEAMFLLQMLKQMRQSMLADENEEPGLGAGTMFDTIDAELSKQLAGQSWRVGFDDVRGDVEGGREWSILDLDAFARCQRQFR